MYSESTTKSQDGLVQPSQRVEPGEISIQLRAMTIFEDINITIKVSESMPWRNFIELVQQNVFSGKLQYHYGRISYHHNDQMISNNEEKSLRQLNIKNQDEIQIRLVLKGGATAQNV